jgi:hypothetical protein
VNAITTNARDIAPDVDRAAAGAALANVILRADLAKLSDGERVTHYNAVCASAGLNPLTRPFEYITLNGKLVLYARKDATDQLRALHRVSVQVIRQDMDAGLVMVTARATTPDGRFDEDFGAVPLPAQGEARANALMKAITKAKRRVTLSICGLGFLDESEIEGIPAEARAVPNVVIPDVIEPAPRETPFTLRFLDDQLSQFGHLDDIKGYLEQPKVKAAYWRAVDAGRGEKWSAIVQEHMQRVAPDLADVQEEPESQETAA